MEIEPPPPVSVGNSAEKTRGKFLTRCAQLLAALGLIRIPGRALAQSAPAHAEPGKAPYNIVFIIVDQRVEKLLAGADYSLPAMNALASHGVTFSKHYISAAQCSPSRASFLTGQPPQVTGVIDQMQFSFVRSLDPKMPNMGSVLKAMGYKTAYFGKFEMDKDILDPEAGRQLQRRGSTLRLRHIQRGRRYRQHARQRLRQRSLHRG